MPSKLRSMMIGALLAFMVLFAFCGIILFMKNMLRGTRKEEVLKDPTTGDVKVLFLHHSTGKNIWNGGVPQWFRDHNEKEGANYSIIEQDFPKESPYGWNNYPYDYYNIWVKNGGLVPHKNEPTLEMISLKYDVVVFKHCFPVSDLLEDTGAPDIDSPEKRVENYKLQYEALKSKLRQFPQMKFIVWTGAALVEDATNEDAAKRAREFFSWVKEQWDETGDTIFIWDLHQLETEGGLYLKTDYAKSGTNSHPNEEFSRRVAPLFCQRVVDVIEGRGDQGSIIGE